MRLVLTVLLALVCVPGLGRGVAAAQASRPAPLPELFEYEELAQSPQLRELRKKLDGHDPSALAAFWKSLGERGAPLVEPLGDAAAAAAHRLLVTFVYRSDRAKSVALMRWGAQDPRQLAPLTRLPGTDLWARSY